MFGKRIGGLRIENNHYFVSRLVSTASLNFQYVTSSIKENTEEVTSPTTEGLNFSICMQTQNLNILEKVMDLFKPKKSGLVNYLHKFSIGILNTNINMKLQDSTCFRSCLYC